ncbi:DUF4198 domain-containing protein [Novilysobacter longmucuonensis]|uniref:DUF4198 domain-containing protein n=1 Tax=Novilysobacter longmucuonensis TaxID=3098603 RepID=UPI002FC82E9F
MANARDRSSANGSIQLLSAVVLAGLFAAPAAAHDFWLAGERAAENAPPAVRMQLGDTLHAEEVRAYDAGSTASLQLVTPDGTRSIIQDTRQGAMPFHTLPRDTPTPAMVVLDRRPVTLALPHEQFADYLREEHLEDMLALQQQQAAGASGEDRERYTRHIKVLVTGPDAGEHEVHSEVIGLPLEIVLLDAPEAPAADQRLRAQVLFHDEPLADATLTVLHHPTGSFTSDGSARTVQTDADGIATFEYDKPGFWMLRMVHMHPCTGCRGADWRSYWAAYAIQQDWLPAAN